jgi:hypothetical protein
VHGHDVPYNWLTDIGRLDGNTDKLNVESTERVTTFVDIAWNNPNWGFRKTVEYTMRCAVMTMASREG